jgi:hypothetical protein
VSIFGKIFHAITGAVGGFITGGPLGAVGGAIKGVMSKPMPAPMIDNGSTAAYLRASNVMPGGGISTPNGIMGQGGGLIGTARGTGGFLRRATATRAKRPAAKGSARKWVTIGGRRMTKKQAKYFGGGRRRRK